MWADMCMCRFDNIDAEMHSFENVVLNDFPLCDDPVISSALGIRIQFAFYSIKAHHSPFREPIRKHTHTERDMAVFNA